MPMLLPYLHDIAIEKNRSVLFLDFARHLAHEDFILFKYQKCILRNEILEWLEQKKIKFSKIMVNDNGYRGEIYIDVPYDLEHPIYKILAEHIENNDGTPKIDGVNLYYLPLENALEMKKDFHNSYYEN